MKKIVAGIGLVLLSVSFSTAHPAVSSLDTAKMERLVLQKVNNERSKKRLSKYGHSDELAKLAGIHSGNMIKHKSFSHVDHNGMNSSQRKMNYFPQLFAGATGENIAYVFGKTEEQVAKTLMTRWMSSSGHRGNILSKDYSHIGIGIKQKGAYLYATQVFADLVAIMVTELSEVVPYGSEQQIKFKFLGNFPKEKITIFVHFPDKTARFYTKGRSYFQGYGSYQPRWNGEYFTITVKFDKGTGTYNLTLGKHGTYYPDGLKILVK
jgi:uncharacterized protein YkwD